jgi:PleD family two-component response regulator
MGRVWLAARSACLRASSEVPRLLHAGERLGFAVAMGAADYKEGQGVSAWINAADSKLYRGKQSGKNQVVW